MTTPREDATRIEADDSGYAALPDGSVFPVGRGHSVTVHPHESHTCRECGAVITVPYVRPTTPREDAIAALDVLRLTGEQLDSLGADEFIIDWDEHDEFVRLSQVRAALGAEAETPTPWRPKSATKQAIVAAYLASPETAEALARALVEVHGDPSDFSWRPAAILAAMRETGQ